MSSMTVRVVGYSNVIKYRMFRLYMPFSNLSVAACQRDHHPSFSPQTLSVFRDPYLQIVTSSETGTLTDGLVGIHLCRPCRPCRPSCHHGNNPCHCISGGRRVYPASDPRPYRRHANFVWVGFGPHPSGSPWLYCSHRNPTPLEPVGNLKHFFRGGYSRRKRPSHLSSYAGRHI